MTMNQYSSKFKTVQSNYLHLTKILQWTKDHSNLIYGKISFTLITQSFYRTRRTALSNAWIFQKYRNKKNMRETHKVYKTTFHKDRRFTCGLKRLLASNYCSLAKPWRLKSSRKLTIERKSLRICIFQVAQQA